MTENIEKQYVERDNWWKEVEKKEYENTLKWKEIGKKETEDEHNQADELLKKIEEETNEAQKKIIKSEVFNIHPNIKTTIDNLNRPEAEEGIKKSYANIENTIKNSKNEKWIAWMMGKIMNRINR